MQSLCALPLVTGARVREHYFSWHRRRLPMRHLQQSFLEQVASAVAVALDDCLVHEEVRRLERRTVRAENRGIGAAKASA